MRFYFGLGFSVGIVATLAASYVKMPSQHLGYKAGDRVKITEQCFEMNCWYSNCKKLTFLSSQRLNRNASDKPVSVAWVLAEQCPWYQYPDIGMETDQAVVTLKFKEFEGE